MNLFVSYSRDDSVWVKELVRELRDSGIHTVWMDTSTLVGGQDWWQGILQGIENADCVIAILTPKSVASTFCSAELNYAYTLNKPILPLTIKPQNLTYPDIINKSRTQVLDVSSFSLERTLLLCERSLNFFSRQHNLYQSPNPLPQRPQVPEPITLSTTPVEQSTNSSSLKLGNTRKKLFICYRRRSWGYARQLRDNLAELLDADIFMDLTSIDEDEFESAILKSLHASDVVLVAVTEYTFDPARIYKEDDWVRHEIRDALQLKKPIALACFDGLFPPTDLPEDIRAIRNKEGKRLFAEFFLEGCFLLASHVAVIGNIPLKPLTSSPISKAKATSNRIPHSVNFDERCHRITQLMETGDFAQAVFELDELLSAGYKSTKYWDAESIRQEATQLRDEVARRDQMKRDYNEIAASVRIARTQRMKSTIKIAWAQFRTEYPEFGQNDDTDHLKEKLGITDAYTNQYQADLTATFKYDVFISHASADKPIVMQIVEELKFAGITYWIDHEQITFGDRITEKIEEGLQQSKHVVVCLSSNLGRSNWCRAEYAPILHRSFNKVGSKKAIPIRLDECTDEQIPILLYDVNRVDYADKIRFDELLLYLKK